MRSSKKRDQSAGSPRLPENNQFVRPFSSASHIAGLRRPWAAGCGAFILAALLVIPNAGAQDQPASVDAANTPFGIQTEHLVDRLIEQDPLIEKLQDQLQTLATAQNAALAKLANPSHADRDPTIKALEAQIADVQKQIDARRNELLPKIKDLLKLTPGQSQPEKSTLPSLDELLAKAMENHPDLIAARAKVTLAEAELKGKQIEVSRQIIALRDKLQYAIKSVDQANQLVALRKKEIAALEARQKAIKEKGIDIKSETGVEQMNDSNLASNLDNERVWLTEGENTLAQAEARLAQVQKELSSLVGEGSANAQTRWTSPTQSSAPLQIPRGPLVARLKAALDDPTDLELQNNAMPLNAIIEYLTDRHKIPVYIHVDSTIDPTTSLDNIRIKDLPLRYALEAIQDDFDGKVEFIVRDYGIVLVNKSMAEKNGYVSAVTFGLKDAPSNSASEDSAKRTSTNRNPPAKGIK